ncbi:MAG: M23 family metallopeptidase, partial [Leptospiraceae bacterium]|nr:M23 family metallopeptidase [Leptospiraceae bacterium]
MKNSFSFPEDEIYFGRLSPPKFKYSVSSCILEEYCGHNLFDSNPSSDWTAIKESNEEWILIDFGSKRLMNRIQLEVSRLSDPIPTVDIQVKHRDEWKTISSYNFPRGKQIFEIGSLDASIIRIFFPKRTASVISISGLTVLLNENILTGIDSKYTGYIFPIKNGLIPDNDYGLPGAPRKYRNGVHKGLDISFVLDKDNKQIPLTMDTPIRAIQDGYIVRADLNYEPMTLKDYEDITTYNQSHPVTYVDKDFGGRQIWIDHRNGVMSSNNHMSKIAKGLKIGSYVKKGQIIGN